MVNGVRLLHGGHAPGCGRSRCGHGRVAVDAWRTRRRARHGRARGSFQDAGWPTGPTASEERILYVTPGYRLVALDAKTGIPVPRFWQSRHRRSEDLTTIRKSIWSLAKSGCTPLRSWRMTS